MINLFKLLTLLVSLMSYAKPIPAEINSPASEFLNGNKKTFSTGGHVKSKDVNFSISYPNSWTAAEGDRPNVVKKFTSNHGKGFEMLMIITKKIPLPPRTNLTNRDIYELFSPHELQRSIPDGATFLGAKRSEIESIPAGIMEYRIDSERAGVRITSLFWTLNFIFKDTLVQVQFSVSGKSGSNNEIAKRMESYKPLFILMANSIIIPEIWNSY